MSHDFLRRLPIFSGLSEEDLHRLISMADPVTLEDGQVLMQEGTPGDAFYVLLEGRLEITKRAGGKDLVIAVRGEGEVFGEMSLIEESPRSATVRALGTCELLKISKESFGQLLQSSPTAALAMLRTVTERLRNTESMLRQSEKMAALGTLAAGLAHELNNPAAALRRSADLLRAELLEWERLNAAVAPLEARPEGAEALRRLRAEIVSRTNAPPHLEPLAASDRESELAKWLEDLGVPDAWDAAPPLVAAGWDRETLALATQAADPSLLPTVLRWASAGTSVYTLIDEAAKSAQRISEIVRAVKSYAYLDQAPVQEVDIHEGLENTLVILRHKWKGGIEIARQYAPDLPRIEAFASELNQVWTNIIDNAIDAMQGKGRLSLKTYRQDGQIIVEITDTGPGIDPKIRDRIFDPFFTTKPPGVGTGLGLHIAYNIVVHRHQGQIEVDSRPGGTSFRVSLPVERGDAKG